MNRIPRPLAVSLFCLLSSCSQMIQNGEGEPRHDRARQAAIRAAETAERVVADLEKRQNEGEALTPSFVDLYCSFSRRAAEASEIAYAGDQAKIVGAWKSHAARMTALAQTLNRATHSFILRAHPVEYFIHDAEIHIAMNGG